MSGTHALLRVDGIEALVAGGTAPRWAVESLRRAPWVVVRRAGWRDGLWPVGVRGVSREQRFAAWLPHAAVVEQVTPQALAARRPWKTSLRARGVPALAALNPVAAIMRDHGFESRWGPVGSVGFELASSSATANRASDLDLALHLAQPISIAAASSLHAALARLPVQSDVLLETPHGAVSLGEYARAPRAMLLRTADGPRLVRDPWLRGSSDSALHECS